MKLNCLTFALRLFRYRRNGDHLLMRKSHWGWFPHFAVVFEMADGSLAKYEYLPTEPRPKGCPPLFFNGRVKITRYAKED